MKVQLVDFKQTSQILIQVTFAALYVRVCRDTTFGPSNLYRFTLALVYLTIYVNLIRLGARPGCTIQEAVRMTFNFSAGRIRTRIIKIVPLYTGKIHFTIHF